MQQEIGWQWWDSEVAAGVGAELMRPGPEQWMGREDQEGGDIYIFTPDSLHCTT